MPKKSVAPMQGPPAPPPPRLTRIIRATLTFTAARFDEEGHYLGEEILDGQAILMHPWTISTESLAGVIEDLEGKLNGF